MLKHFFSRALAGGVAGLTIVSCTTSVPVGEITVQRCENLRATLDVDFSNGAMAGCLATGKSSFEVAIAPEDAPPINPSPWYALRLTPMSEGPVSVTLRYTDDYSHRYRPKLSADGKTWTPMAANKVKIFNQGKGARLSVRLEQEPVFLAGQELYTNDMYDDWMRKAALRAGMSVSTIGTSVEGRAIKMLTSRAETSKPVVVLVGRQHPPEVTGALNMTYFVASILDQTPLAQSFREDFNVLIVPNMNPDGVEHGHWRHNMRGTDLNRDWGPFTQPETQSVKAVLDDIKADVDRELVLFLDFHSTKRNVFYTQTKEDESTGYDFTGKWLANSRARLPTYDFARAERHNSDLATSKNYIHQTFDVPAMTFETGDETDRQEIKHSAKVFAEEMMKLLLEHEVD